MRARSPELDRVAVALRLLERRSARVVVIRHPASPRRLRFTADASAFWGEVVAPRLGRRGGERLAALGWRPPAPHMPGWFQYFQPTRKRHYRWLSELATATFRDGLGLAEAELTVDVDTTPPAVGPGFVFDEVPSRSDANLLDQIAQVMAGFGVERYPTHLECEMLRGRHRARLAVICRERTVSCIVLHLPAPEPAMVDAALSVSDLLDRVPYTYGLRTVAGHGESLVLQTKFAFPVKHPPPFMVATLMHSAVEPLLADLGALRDGAWGG